MLTFSVNNDKNEGYVLKVKKAIDDNIRYFKKFNNEHWEEAVQRAYITAIANQNDNYTNIEPYIKNLARNILKTQPIERPYDIVTEDGEISYPYLQLTTFIDESIFIDNKEVEDTFKELYLLCTDDFLKMQNMFKNDIEDNGMKVQREDIIKNNYMKERIEKLCYKYGSQDVFYMLYSFLKRIPKYTTCVVNTTTKEIEMKERNSKILEQIPDIPLIKDSEGRYIGIDKNTLTMEVDPDFIKWDTVANTSSDIMKIDITPLMDYMYEQVCVPKGVHTRHIYWCDDMYRLTTPAGKKVVNMDKYKFLNLVRVELIENLIANRFNSIIALSPDNVYLKPPRVLMYDTIRLILTTGKVIDLPITTHIKNRH